jgi:hypothetical protein
MLNQAYAFTNGVGTFVNCSAPTVVSTKTRLLLSFTYPMNINVGTTNGSIKVYINGQKVPRYIDAITTPDAYYKEIDQSTIELDSDYSSFAYSLEVIQDIAVTDVSDNNSTNILAITNSQLKNSLINSAFDFWQRGTSVTVANTVATYLADRWYAKNSLGTNGVLTYSQVAGSLNGSKYGAKVQITTAPTAAQTNGTELYQVLENFDTLPLLGQNISFGINIKAFGNVNQIGLQFCYATSEIKPTLFFGTEKLVTVNSSSFTLGTVLAQNSTLPTNSGVIGVRIRITGISSGNTYDLNNGFVVEQAMLNIGFSVMSFGRAGRSAQDELSMCQRYYYKTFNQGVTPVQNSGDVINTVSWMLTGSGFGSYGFLRYPVPMFKTPVLTTYNPSATNASARNTSAGADIGTLTSQVDSVALMFTSSGTNDAINQKGQVHVTLEAEI